MDQQQHHLNSQAPPQAAELMSRGWGRALCFNLLPGDSDAGYSENHCCGGSAQWDRGKKHSAFAHLTTPDGSAFALLLRSYCLHVLKSLKGTGEGEDILGIVAPSDL